MPGDINVKFDYFLQELQSFEVPQLITLVDGSKGNNQICVGYKNQFDLIHEKNGDTLQMYNIDTNKVIKVILEPSKERRVFIISERIVPRSEFPISEDRVPKSDVTISVRRGHE